MKIILLNGKIGAGKSVVGYALHRKLINSAFIEGDAFLQINPFNPSKEQYLLVAKNIVQQIKTYAKFKNITYVVLSWIIRDKEVFDLIKNSLNKFDLYPICLENPDDILKTRVEKQIKNGNKFDDNIDKIKSNVYQENFISINGNQNVDEIVVEIEKIINN